MTSFEREFYKQLEKQRAKQSAAKRNSGGKNKSAAAATRTYKAPETNGDGRTWFQKSAYFGDGYQRGDVAKTILASSVDLSENATAGLLGIAEGGIDTAASFAAAGASNRVSGGKNKREKKSNNVGGKNKDNRQAVDAAPVESRVDKVGDEIRSNIESFIAKDIIDEKAIAEKIVLDYGIEDVESKSVFGEKSRGVIQSGGQLLGQIGLQAAGIPWWMTTGVTSFGGEVENALKQGASINEAALSGSISAAGEIIGEKLVGGVLSKSGVGDDAIKHLSRRISNKLASGLLNATGKGIGEGLEEIFSSAAGKLGQKLTYESEKTLKELLMSEEAFDEYLEAFIGGAVLGSVGQGVEAVNAKAKGVDYVTGLTANEDKVVKKLYEDRIAEKEKDGKLTYKQKNEIYDKVVEEMEKGEISIDTIEELLGGDSYKAYRDIVDREEKDIADLAGVYKGDELFKRIDDYMKSSERGKAKSKLSNEVFDLVKDSRLAESYYEVGRRRESFKADPSKYSEKQRIVVQKAIDSGVLNNTRRTHLLVDVLARISEDKDVDFDFATNQKLKESGFAVEGADVNGYVVGNNITINMNSRKAWEFTVGHEITHALEGTELYGELQKAMESYAKGRKSKSGNFDNEYSERFDKALRLYEKLEGYKGAESHEKVKKEVIADLVGDYIFNDTDFIRHLSTKHRNVFEKIYDEIKYLAKVVTAGSEEARQIEKIKKVFEDAYRAEKNTATDGGAKYALSENAVRDVHDALYNKGYEGEVKLTENTPTIITSQKGARNLPMLMNASHIRENVFSEEEAKEMGLRISDNINYHGLGEPLFLKVIDELDEVTEAYRGTKNADDPARRENYFLLISQQKDADGNTINVPVFINEKGLYNRVFIDRNKIATVFGRSELRKYIREQISKGNLVRVKNKSTQSSESTSPINADFRKGASLDEMLSQEGEGVKSFSDIDGDPVADEGEMLFSLSDDDIAPVGDNAATTLPDDFAPVNADAYAPLPAEDNNLVKETRGRSLDRNAYISGKAEELYRELQGLKKGVRASEQLGFLLDYGYEWRTVKTALLNIRDHPDSRVDYNSAIESIAREMLNEDYADRVYEMEIAPTPTLEEAKSKKGGEIKGQQSLAKDVATYGEGKRVAQVLTEEPKVQKRKSGIVSWIKNNILDRGMVFEDLSLKTGNRELQARWNTIRYAEARAQRFMEKGNESASSLKSIREAVEQTGKTQKFYEYLYHQLNVDRMTLEDRYKEVENKPVFGDSYTAEMSKTEAALLEKANPEFKQYAQKVYDYMSNLREMLVAGGVISKETADLWVEMYPHFVPIRRVGDNGLNIDVPLDTRRTGVNAPIKRAKGGSRDILPLFDTMAQRTIQTYKAIAKNRFGVELKNTLGTTISKEAASVDEVIDSVDTHEGLLQEGKDGKSPTFTVFEDGKKVTFEITDEMYDAMKPKSEAMAYTNKVLNTASNIRRGTITEYNPWFLLKNAVKDVQDVLINSQHAGRTYAAIPKAIKQMATNGHWYTEYLENGGEQNTYFDNETNTFKTEKSAWDAAKKVTGLEAIAKANNVIERLPRLAEYIASREAGRSVDVAMLDAARVTTNFAAGGDLTKFLNRNGATFLNASVQGAMQQARNIREAKANGLRGWASLAGKFVAAGLPVIALNHLIWDDDEEYEELSDYVKQDYYIVGKFENGQFVRIPKGRTVAVIQNAFEQMDRVATGNDEADLKSFLDLVVSNLAPNNPIENNILSPIFQVANNETWYGEKLVPTRLENLPAAEQYDESTDSISRWLGETVGVSPYKTNYLLDQYSGVIGDTFLPMLTPEAERGDNSALGNMIAPLKDMFITDSVMKNQNVSDFYETKDKLTEKANSMRATDEDVLKFKYINSVSSEMGEMYGMKRELQNSDIPDDEKYAMVREIQQEIDDLARESLNTYEGVHITGDYATVGDRHYKRNKEGAWEKITDKQLEKQETVTRSLDITPAEYWSDKEEYDYAYEYPEKYAVAKSVGGYNAFKNYSSKLYDIKADKDKNGKSIAGSRKKKVINYINGLDADYGEKIILFKFEYPSDDTYNYDIIEYLNSRDDISRAEMVAILKELGFTVSGDRVSWD